MVKKPEKIKDRATAYALSVLDGEILAGPIVHGACQRHLNDLEHAGDRGFYYDEKEAAEAMAFFEEILHLAGGQYEGLPFILLPWEAFIIGSIFGWRRKSDDMRRFRVAYVETGKGPLALDTPIATPLGWSTMGKIKPGDYVFNSLGKATRVISVSPIFYNHECYKLRFSDDSEIIADAEHEWFVSSLRSGEKPGPHNGPKKGGYWKRNTEYISKTYILPESSSQYPQAKWNHRIDIAPALDLPDINLPIKPYTLGAWLGDGDSDGARITGEDEEIMDNIKADGYLVGNKYFKSGNKVFRQPFGLIDATRCKRGHLKSIHSNGLHCRACERELDRNKRTGRAISPTVNVSIRVVMRKMGLFKEKHIPELYFRAGTGQRLSLLQGIMDADGHIAKNGHCEITLCNKQLIYDVMMLLKTLGYKCTVKESAAKLNGIEISRRWRISFQAYWSQPPIRLKRKLSNLSYEPTTKPLCQGRMIVSCDPVESVPVRCITVASDDHMFLAGRDFIPTYNSGKSPLAAGIGLKGLVADNEPRAEIYAAATFRDQAMVLFRDACAFYDQSPELQKRLTPSGVGEKRWNLAYLDQRSFFRVISSEKKGQSGPRPHMALLDEVHEHTDGTVIEMLRAGFKFRRQPLSFMITNSGYDKTSVCWEYHDMGMKIATGVIENDEFFAYICSLDEADLVDDKYLEDESLWPKVNPSLEYGLPGYDYIRNQIAEARGMPSKMSTVKRLSFCVWTEAENPWISPEIWIPCRDNTFDDSLLAGRKCWGGLDLSAVNDLTAFGLMFEPSTTDPMYRLKVWFWLPGENLKRKSKVDHVPYDVWKKQGHLFTSKGSAISKTQVIKFIYNEIAKYQLVGIAYDRNRMKDLIEFAEKEGIELAIGKWDKDKRVWNFDRSSGIKMMPFGQEARSMAPAIDKFETFLLEKQFRHDGNPCLTWCASNVVVDSDDSGYRKMSKKKSVGRIDGIVASVMACGILEDTQVKSVYEGMTKDEILERISF